MNVVRRGTDLVYEYSGPPSDTKLPPKGYEWCLLDEEKVHHFFSFDVSDHWRYKSYTKLLKSGYLGHIFFKDDEWAAVQWLATPNSPGPPHLPQKIASGKYWCFNEHTRESHRKMGLWNSLKDNGVKLVREQTGEPTPLVYSDTDVANFASRRAHESYGFCAAGTIERVTLRFPRLASITWGSWNRDGQHPPIEQMKEEK